MEPGIVYLVGAGPGDPELITVKGLNILRQAEVVLYDSLIPFQLLKETKSGCELIAVGKRSGNHTMVQEKINSLMLTQARQGRTVVRLKGGDPFLFGRGSEEAMFLLKNEIEVRVIPGISSAMAAPLAAGIPLTERTLAGSVTFISASNQNGELPHAIPQADTLVFLMVRKNLAKLVHRLLEAGFPVTTNCAIIENGTKPNQRVLETTLAKLATESAFLKLRGPVLFLVGRCVTRTKELAAIYQYNSITSKRKSGAL